MVPRQNTSAHLPRFTRIRQGETGSLTDRLPCFVSPLLCKVRRRLIPVDEARQPRAGHRASGVNWCPFLRGLASATIAGAHDCIFPTREPGAEGWPSGHRLRIGKRLRRYPCQELQQIGCVGTISLYRRRAMHGSPSITGRHAYRIAFSGTTSNLHGYRN